MPSPFRTWAGWMEARAARRNASVAHSRRSRDNAMLSAIVETLEPRLMLCAAAGDDGEHYYGDGHDHSHHDDGTIGHSHNHDEENGHGPGCNCGNCCQHEFDIYGNEVHGSPAPDEALEPGTTGNFDGKGTLSPLADTFKLHSNPNSDFTIFLDFDGHTTSGTSWNGAYNGGADIVTAAYSFEGGSSFSNNELTRIQYIWQRVAEDFLPFNVDVTTEDPGTAGLSKNGSGDTEYGIRVVIGGNGSWYGSAGGVAYVGSFDWSSDTPTFVFEDNLGNGNEKFTAEAISHEVGHTLGLSHDGNGGSSYYQGHGSGATGWAPIMGSGYYKDLTQWSKGEYSGANNTQDDLSIITSSNGFGYRADDYGNTNGSSSALVISGSDATGSGIIETNTDVDVFSFETQTGTISFDVSAVYRGPNLDILAELYDSSGNLVHSSNPETLLSASFSTSVTAGTYYLHISGTGKGSPTSGGYSDYGSLGGYLIEGTVIPSGSVSDFSIAANSANKNEGNSGTTSFTFTVSRTGDTGSSASVDYTVSGNGTHAATSSDFNGGFASGTVNFAAGETSKTITIQVNGDTTIENDEGFKVVLSNASGSNTISTSTATGTIQNDDVAPADLSIAATSANKNEGNSGTTSFTFTVTRSGNTGIATTVDYAVSGNGTHAASSSDFNGGFASGTISFAAGETSKTITVQVNGDTTVENDEGFKVVLSNAGANTNISTSTATGTIQNDDVAPADLSIAATSANKNEGNSGTTSFTFTVTRSGNTGIATTVDYAVSGNGTHAASSSDFNGGFASGTISFASGETSKTITVQVNGDTTVENDEGFKVVLSNAGANTNISTSTATGTIQNDDIAPANLSIAATSADKNEGNSGTTSFTFTVTRSGNTGIATTVDYDVSGNGSNAATASDFNGGFASGTISFASGETSKTITVQVNGDTTVENDEGFKVVLSNPGANTNISTSTATGTIQNDDAVHANFAISATSADKNEGNSGTTSFTFTVTRSGNTSINASVDYDVSGNGTHAATSNDFNGGFASGTLNFASGETSKTITVQVNGDTTIENDEGFKVVLSNANGSNTISTSTANGTIQNDDIAPANLSIAATSANKNEGNSGTTSFTFTVTRSGNTSIATTVDYDVSGNGTNAATSSDFNGGFASGTVSFAAGQTSKTITVQVNGDTTVENDEGFKVVLSNAGANTNITTSTATGTIQNDDIVPANLSIAATSANKNEGNSGTTSFTFTVTRSGNTGIATTVDYTVSGNGTNAATSSDFNGGFGSGTISFAAGETSKTITVQVNGDTTVENDEGFKVVLSNSGANTNITTSTATGTIQNDDIAPSNFSISASSANKNEGNSGTTSFTFTVTRTGNTAISASVDYTVSGNGTHAATSSDFSGGFASGTVNFAAGETSKTITIQVNGDTTVENDEGFKVVLSNASGNNTISTSTAVGTIRNDDVAPSNFSISATSANKNEGNSGTTVFTFTVTRGGNTGITASVDYDVSGNGGNAASSSDFQGGFASGTLTFTAGQTSKTITVLVNGDTTVEANEGFKVVLSNASGNNTISTSTATGTIQNDDVAPANFSISASSANKNEGNSGTTSFTFTVTRSGNTGISASVDYAVSGNGTNAANADDFNGGFASGTVSFAAGQTSKTITVVVKGDVLIEADEGFKVVLSNAGSNNTISNSTATGTIQNDDNAPNIAGDYVYDSRVTRVEQDGVTLTFTNEHGGTATGTFLTADTIVATTWGNMTGTIIDGDIHWSNGGIWIRGSSANVAGEFIVGGKTAKLEQSGISLTFTNEHGGTASGILLSDTRVRVYDWGNLEGTIQHGNIVWDNGSAWIMPSNWIDGAYAYRNKVASVTQSGTSITFTNENGGVSAGVYIGVNQVRATDWGVNGTIVNGNITWASGNTWEELDVGGSYIFNGKTTRIEQFGANLTIYNEHGNSSSGVFLNANRIKAIDWGGLVGTISSGSISWSNGSTWTALPDIAGNYTINGQSTQVTQSGGNLTFINEHGGSSSGVFISATQVRADDWGGLIGTLSGGNIHWSNGGVWTRVGAGSLPASLPFVEPAFEITDTIFGDLALLDTINGLAS